MKKIILFLIALFYSSLFFGQDSSKRNATGRENSVTPTATSVPKDSQNRNATAVLKPDSLATQSNGELYDRKRGSGIETSDQKKPK